MVLLDFNYTMIKLPEQRKYTVITLIMGKKHKSHKQTNKMYLWTFEMILLCQGF